MAVKGLSLGSAGSAVGLINVTGSTNASPIVITMAANSGLKNGDRLALAGITGNTNANGEWTLSGVTATTAILTGSVGNGTHGGTVRAATIFDTTPQMKSHSLVLHTMGNLIGTLLLEQFDSYAEFAAGGNALLGSIPAPVVSPAVIGNTNVAATSASSSVVASSTVVMAATMAGLAFEIKPTKYVRASVSAYTSGTIIVVVEG